MVGPLTQLPQLSAEGFIVVNPDGSAVPRVEGLPVVACGLRDNIEIDVVSSVHGCAFSATAGSGDATLPPRSFASRRGTHGASHRDHGGDL